jgi:hypothetical protein
MNPSINSLQTCVWLSPRCGVLGSLSVTTVYIPGVVSARLVSFAPLQVLLKPAGLRLLVHRVGTTIERSVSELVRRRCTSPAGAPQPIAPLDIDDPISMALHHHEIRLARIEAELFGRNTPESDPVNP